MNVTLATIWALPAGFTLEGAQDEGIAVLVDTRTEFQIEEDPDEWDALVGWASSAHKHIRIVNVVIDFDNVIAAFMPPSIVGKAAAG